MAHRSLEETIATIAPSRRRGVPNPPTIQVGAAGDNGDLANSLSQAGQQIAQLQSAYQQQANLIAENTQALQGNTSAHSNTAGNTIGSIASSLLGGVSGLLSPIISGIAGLFGGSPAPAPLPIYNPPPPVSINGVLQSAPPAVQPPIYTPAVPVSGASQAPPVPQPQTASTAPDVPGGSASSNAAPQITVNINAMDSQSFMDRSDDIASAVRAAMLNMHPINNVVADL